MENPVGLGKEKTRQQVKALDSPKILVSGPRWTMAIPV